MNKIKKFACLLILISTLFLNFSFVFADSSPYGWMWGGTGIGSNNTGLGWISANYLNTKIKEDPNAIKYGLTIPDGYGYLSGYTWSENVGWISFNNDDTINCPGGVASGCYAFRNNNNQIGGWARVMGIKREKDNGNAGGWEGWIHLSGTGYGVSIDPTTGKLDGYGWSNEFGWINFSRISPTPPLSQGFTLHLIIQALTNASGGCTLYNPQIGGAAGYSVLEDQTQDLWLGYYTAGQVTPINAYSNNADNIAIWDTSDPVNITAGKSNITKSITFNSNKTVHVTFWKQGSPNPTFSCTGSIPANSTLCSGSNQGLTQDITYSLSSAGICDGTTKCQCTCNSGYTYDSAIGICVQNSTVCHYCSSVSDCTGKCGVIKSYCVPVNLSGCDPEHSCDGVTCTETSNCSCNSGNWQEKQAKN